MSLMERLIIKKLMSKKTFIIHLSSTVIGKRMDRKIDVLLSQMYTLLVGHSLNVIFECSCVIWFGDVVPNFV